MRPEGATPLPVLLIGGYLGAGKTTLVNHLLRHAGGRRIAVLVNDFGDINIDADLIEGEANSAAVLSLAGGCLCCSFGDDLVGTLTQLTHRDPPLDQVLIELSGVALPEAVLRTARLAGGVQIAGTLVVADAAELRRQAADPYVGDTVRQQLADADWIVLNKPDRVDSATEAALMAWLPALAPAATALACAVADLPAEWVMGWRQVRPLQGLAADATTPDTHPHTSPDTAALARLAGQPMRRPAAPASDRFESLHRPLPAGTDLAALGAALAAPGSGVLRAKALAIGPDGCGQLLQVAGGHWAVTPARVRGAGRLVLIGLRGQWAPACLWLPPAAD